MPSDEFSPKKIATLYRARWVVDLVFRELKSQYSLGRFQRKNTSSGSR
ncbi:transposase [Halomarina halobia]|uniref:Transposase n=1 Tax=Halomarina halobia TaxID=3033386 RepID=A0ABD6AE26_9EURY